MPVNLSPKTTSASLTQEACKTASKTALLKFEQFAQQLQSLRSGSTTDLRLQDLKVEVLSMGERNKKNKMTQFDELATLFDRALLSKTVKPIVDKTLSDKESYTNTGTLDDALNPAFADFVRGAAKPLALPTSQDHVKVRLQRYGSSVELLLTIFLAMGGVQETSL
jgi:hypothetical protein